MRHTILLISHRVLLAVAGCCLLQCLLAPQPGRAADDASGAAQDVCRGIVTAEFAYYAANGRYGSQDDLSGAKLPADRQRIADANTLAGENGLEFAIAISEDGQRFDCCCATTAGALWWADETGALRLLDAATAAQALLALKSSAEPATAEQPGSPPDGAETLTGTTTVVLETTKGDIVLDVHHDWSPLGAAHFIELVKLGFYDGAPWFRVINRFVAQCGISADPQLNAAWGEKTIPDEPVLKGNQPGNVAFGKTAAPDSRSTHFYINYGDNSASLDPQGFSAFAEVVDGMDVALSLARCEYQNQQGLALAGGLAAFAAAFPEADYIKRAYIKP